VTDSLSPPAAAVQRPAPASATWPWLGVLVVLLAVLGAAALWLGWATQQRVKELEQQLVKRQEDSGAMANAAQLLAKQAQETARDAAAKMALLEARVAEATLQRSQLEELIQSLSRARDENVLADVETAIRVGPGEPYASSALALLEELIVAGYTGSAGTNVPPDEQLRLEELRNLIDDAQSS